MGESFGNLLAKMSQLDELMTTEINPEELVGDVRDKVDAIKRVVDRFVSYQVYLEEQIAQFSDGARSAGRNLVRLKSYVAQQMQEHKFEQVPGEFWRVKLQDNPMALFIKREPTAEDFVKYPQYAEMRRSYVWRNDKIKEDLAAGTLKDCDFAELTKGQHVRFYLNNQGAKDKTTRKPKKGVVDVIATSSPAHQECPDAD